MATTVDNRVVQMTFNNKAFEKGVDTTLKTIEKLNNALKFKNASDGFDDIQEAANGVNFKSLQDNIQSLSDRFSGLGIIGAQIWTRIGNAAIDLVTGPFKKIESTISGLVNQAENMIVQGGWNRALNLEQAEFMLKNLGHGWDTAKDAAGKYVEYTVNKNGDKVKNAYKAIAESVDGTAFSLDEAASAAANFLASGIDAGDQLYDTLRAVQGLSSVFSTDFSQVAGYFQKMASAGSVSQGLVTYMTQTIGAPISELLKSNLGLTDKELEEALQDGLISFQTFVDIMNKEFGDSLNEANNSFKGVTANIRSAFGRIGANVEEHLIKKAIPALNTFRESINKVNSTLKDAGVYDFINGVLDTLIDKFDRLLKPIADTNKEFTALKNVAEGFVNIGKGISNILSAMQIGFWKVFGGPGQKNLNHFGEGFLNFSEAFLNFTTSNPAGGKFVKLIDVFEALARVVKILGSVLKVVFKIIGTLLGLFVKVLGVATYISAEVINFTARLIKLIKQTKTYNTIVSALKKGWDNLSKAIKTLRDRIVSAYKAFKDYVKENEVLQSAINTLDDAFTFLHDNIKQAKDRIEEFLDNTNLFENLKNIATGAFDAIWDSIHKVIGKIETLTGIDIHMPTLDEVKKAFKDFKEDVSQTLDEIEEYLVWAFQNPEEAINQCKDSINNFIEEVKTKFSNLKSALANPTETINKTFTDIKEGAEHAKDSLKNFFSSENETGDEEIEKKTSIYQSFATALGKVADAIDALFTAIGNVGKTIIDGLITGYEKIGSAIEGMTLNDWLGVLKGIVNTILALDLAKAAKSISTFLNTLSDSAKMNKTTLQVFIQDLPTLFLKMAAAFLIFAYALNVVANIDASALHGAEAVLTGLLLFGLLFLGILKKLDVFGKKKDDDEGPIPQKFLDFLQKHIGKIADYVALGTFISSIGSAIAKIAIGLAVLVKASKGANPSTFAVAAGVIVILIYVVVKLVKDLMESMSGVNVDQLKNLFSTFDMFAIASIIKAIGTAVLVIAFAISGIANIPTTSLAKGIGVVVAIMVLIGALFVVLIKAQKGMLQSGIGQGGALSGLNFGGMAGFLVALVVAILVMVPVIAALAGLVSIFDAGTIMGAIGVLAGICIILGAAAFATNFIMKKSSDGDPTAGPKALIIVAAALLVAAIAVKKLGEVGWAPFVQAIGILAAMGGLLWLASKVSKDGDDALKLSGAIAAIAVALLISAVAIKKLEEIDPERMSQILIFLLVIAGFMALMEGLAAVTSKTGISDGLYAIGAAFLGIGAGVFLFAAALALLFPLMDEMQTRADELKGKIETFTEILVAIILSFFTNLLTGLKNKASELAQDLGSVILAIIIAIVMFLNDNAFAIGEAIGLFIAALAKAFVAAIISLFVDLWNTIKGKDGFDEHSPSKKLLEIGKMAIQGLLNGFKAIIEDVWDFIKGIPGKILEFLGNLGEDLFSLGSSIIGKLGEGISSAIDVVTGAIGAIGDAITSGISSAQDAAVEGFDKIFGDYEEKYKQAQNLRDQAQQDLIDQAMDLWRDEGGDAAIKNIENSYKVLEAYKRDYMTLTRGGTVLEGYEYNRRTAEYEKALANLESAQKRTIEIFQDAKNAGVDSGLRVMVGDTEYVGYHFYKGLAEMATKGWNDGLFKYARKGSASYQWMQKERKDAAAMWGIASPSKVAMWMAKMVVEGWGKGIDDNESIGLKAMATFSEAAMSILDNDFTPTITPVLDLTAVQNGANQIGYIFSEGAKVAAGLDIKSDAGRNAEQLDTLSDLFNQLVFNTDTTNLEGKFDIQSGLLAQVLDALINQKIVLDTGAVVGGIAKPMDQALGKKLINVGRRA